MNSKYSTAKEYDQHIDMLYLSNIKIILRCYGFLEKDITDELLRNSTNQARQVSEATSLTMNKSIEKILEPIKLKYSMNLAKKRFTKRL